MIMVSIFPQFRAMILVFLPKAIQGTFAAAGDYYTWKLAEKLYGTGSNAAWTAVSSSFSSSSLRLVQNHFNICAAHDECI